MSSINDYKRRRAINITGLILSILFFAIGLGMVIAGIVIEIMKIWWPMFAVLRLCLPSIVPFFISFLIFIFVYSGKQV